LPTRESKFICFCEGPKGFSLLNVVKSKITWLCSSRVPPCPQKRVSKVLDIYNERCYTIGMSNINDIKTIYSAVYALGLLAILALGLLVMPMKAEAAYNYVFNSGVNVQSSFPTVSNTTNMNYVPNNYNNYQYPAPTQTYYPVYPVSTQTTYIVPTVDSTKTVAKTSTNSTVKKATTTTTTAKTEVSDKYEALAANAIFGDVGFLPSGLLQWILFAILVLIIVILTRRVFGGAKKYHQTPLKHA